MHNRRFANVWIKIRAGWVIEPAVGVIGVLIRPLLAEAKQGIPVAAH